MFRLLRLAALVAAIAMMAFGSPALAGVPKMVFAENFGATW